jgi:hypothetical protein
MLENKLNDNDFGKILGKIVLNRLNESEKKFREIIKNIASSMTKAIYDEKYDQIYDFEEERKICKNYVEIYAAASYLRDYIFNNSKRYSFNNNGKPYRTYMHTRKHIKFESISTNEWKKDSPTFTKEIDGILYSKGVKEVFVYMFWSSRRKVKYFYVGVTKRRGKRFSWHPVAFACAKDSEKLTTINLDNKTLLKKVEACIIRILGRKKEKAGNFGLSKYSKDILEYNKISGISLKSLKCDLDEDYNKLKTIINNFRKLKKNDHKKSSESDKIFDKMQEIEKQIYKI